MATPTGVLFARQGGTAELLLSLLWRSTLTTLLDRILSSSSPSQSPFSSRNFLNSYLLSLPPANGVYTGSESLLHYEFIVQLWILLFQGDMTKGNCITNFWTNSEHIVQLLIEYAMKLKLLRIEIISMIKERGKEKGEIEEAKRRRKETNILERKQKEQGISKKKN